MHFTDIFIKRPVLATVVSLAILLLGLAAMGKLTVRQYPELRNAVVNVTTVYVGADSELIQGFITSPLEREIASADGIDYISSTSSPGVSQIQAHLRLTTDPNIALTQIATKVNKLRSQLPQGSEDPVVELAEGQGTAAMYLSFYSKILDNNQITDYLSRVVQPQLATLPGVQKVEVIGARTFAMRIWLNPEQLTAHNLTAAEVFEALRANNYLAALGESKGSYVKVNLTARTDLKSADEFKQLVLRSDGSSVVRLGDVARVVLGAENYETEVSFNGDNAIFMGIQVQPDANVIDVIRGVREAWPGITAQFPEGLSGVMAYDSTLYIEDAIKEVRKTLIEAIFIVIAVIFLFLGSMRSALIPAVTVPLSLVGGLFLMYLAGFSINLLTLLSMVLAIGLVVDDAIIVLENVHRHIEEGKTPTEAAIVGARELVGPVIAMTITLVAVYLPIGFMGGLTGTLFTEFAFSLAGAVLISGVVALTLTPMMSAKLLKPHGHGGQGGLAAKLDALFERLRLRFQRVLHSTLDTVPVTLLLGSIVLVSCYFLYRSAPSELAPAEDQGFALIISEADSYASIDYTTRYTNEITKAAKAIPEVKFYFLLNGLTGANGAISGMVMKPWSERERGTQDVVNDITGRVSQIAGLQNVVIQPPPLPTGGFGFPIEFVVTTTQPPRVLNEVVQQLIGAAYGSKKFLFVNSDLKIDRPQVEVEINRDKAALMGVDMRRLGGDLQALLAGGYVNRFALENRSYKVIPQVERGARISPDQLSGYYTRAGNGQLIPVSTLVTLKETVQPQALRNFQQKNAATLQGVPRPGVSMGDALATLEAAAKKIMPQGFGIDFAGQSRQYKQEGTALAVTFGFALALIYLVLAAQFESFRDPLVMLVTVPMSICGALIFVSLGFTSLNIYTQVGLVTLIGVISKHGILIVEFANQLQKRGHSKREAIEQATGIRLRPVLMTTAALVVAMVPLLIASGPGAAARFAMGLVITAGMLIGTFFTLFVVPAMYMVLGRIHAPDPAPAALRVGH